MSVRALLTVICIAAIPCGAADNFGALLSHPQPIADLAIDPVRPRLYVLNTAAEVVENYDITVRTAPSLRSRVTTGDVPLAMAVSPSGTELYVVNYGSSSLQIVDITTAVPTTKRTVTLQVSPLAVAVGFNGQVLISTIGTGTGQLTLLTYDPGTGLLGSIAVGPPAPAVPTLTAPNLIWAQAARAKLQASADGRTIVGVHMLANNSRTMFVFDVDSATVLRSRNVAGLSSVLAVSPNGSQFLSGPLLVESSTMLVLAQQNVINSPYVFPANANFNTQATQGGAVYAQTLIGPALIAGYNILPTLVPAARANSSQLVFNTTDNLLIQLGLQIRETLSGRMVVTADSSTIYAVSQSGFMALPIGGLAQQPLAMPDSNVALLASDQCGLTAALNSAVIPVRNAGGGRSITVTAQPLAASATAATVRTTPRPYGGDVTATFNAGAARTIGTAAPDLLLVQASEAINIAPNVRVYQNNRNTETRGTILPVDSGPTTTGLTDLVADTPRQRLYIANPSLNRVEIFDIRQQRFMAPIRVGQLPRSMAIAGDGNTLFVANAGSESITLVDLNRGAVSGRIAYPPIPFNAAFGILTPQLLASTQGGVQVLMSDGTLWKVVGSTVQPRTLNTTVFGTVRSIPGPQSMVASPDGAYLMLLAGNGTAYLYDSTLDDFVTGRAVLAAPITGYYGPVAAGPLGGYYLANGQLLNSALTNQGGSGGTGPVGGGGLPAPGGPAGAGRPVAAVAAVNAQMFARYSTPIRANAAAVVTDAGMVEIVEAATLRTVATAQGLEGPLAIAAGTARVNISARLMAVDLPGQNAYVLTASGLSIIPLTSAATQNAPAVPGNGVVNTANYTAGIAPGGLISIFGRNLGTTAVAPSTPLPTVLGGACVTLSNTPIPLLATSGGQINAQIPPTVAAGRYPLIVRSIVNQAVSGTVTITVARYAPAIFIDELGPAIFHQNGQRVDKAHPAKRDEPLTIYATGMGTTTGGRVTAGTPAPSSPLAVTGPVNLYFGDPTYKQAAVIVDWSGLAPGFIGLYQINARVPGFHMSGDALPVTLRIGGVNSVTTGAGAARVYVD
jgi:uncharacterized protein (TIGR03437 family)